MLLPIREHPNYLPGASVLEKIRAADSVIFLDECQFTHNGWTNRNRMPDGSWLTVPIEHSGSAQAMNRVRISEHGSWRTKHSTTLRQHYGEAVDPLVAEINAPYRLLIGLNLALLRLLLADCDTAWHFQSHLDGGRAVTAVSDDRIALAPISQRLAMMVAEVGGRIYLSGPSGHRYLDEKPFEQRGITVRYWDWKGPNPCGVERLVSRQAKIRY